MGAVDEIGRAKQLLDAGAISVEEYERLKGVALRGEKGKAGKTEGRGSGCAAIVMAVILLGGVSAVWRSLTDDPVEVERAGVAFDAAVRAKRLLEARLRDPDSVRYSGVLAKAGVVCGMFNAKNGFGGYAGDELFLGAGYPEMKVYIDADDGFDKLWSANCKDLTGFTRID